MRKRGHRFVNTCEQKMVEKEATIPIGTRIPQSTLGEIVNEIKGTDQKLSDWYRDAIEEKLTNDNKDKLDAEIKYHEEMLDQLKKKKANFREKEKTLAQIPEKELAFLLESKKVIDQDFGFIKGRINLYKNKFHKPYRVSEQDFVELMNKAEEQRALAPEMRA